MIGAKAGVPTTDYMYATGLKYDGRKSMYFFDVCLEGANYYTSYGVDIQLPIGLQVSVLSDRTGGKKPNITILNEGMYEDEYGSTEHSIGVSFPYETDFTHARVGCMSNGNYDMGRTSGSLFRVYVTTDYTANTWPIGAIKLYAVELNKVGQAYEAPDKETIVALNSGETTLPLNISSAAKWSTCVLPFATAIPDGVKAYTCSTSDEEYLYLTDAESIEAYKPYVLYAENGYEGNVSGTVNADECPEAGVVTDGYLCGAVVAQTAKSGYVLQKHDDDVKFYAIGDKDSFTIPAGKCWLNPTGGTQAKALKFNVGGNVTAINAAVVPTTSASVYDVAGRQRQDSDKGLLIKNGKKIFKK